MKDNTKQNCAISPTHILGAGWAGMIAAEFWPTAAIYERDPYAATLTGTTGAFIRCREPNVAVILQAPSRMVMSNRAVADSAWNTHRDVQPRDAALYARSVTPGGALAARSIQRCALSGCDNSNTERYLLLPEDLVVARRRAGRRVHYGVAHAAVEEVLRGATPDAPVVSTLPIELTLSIIGSDFAVPPRPELPVTQQGFVLETNLLRCDLDFCWTVYVPCSSTGIVRITIAGGRAVVEIMSNERTAESNKGVIEAEAAQALFQLFDVHSSDIVQWCWHRTTKFAAVPEYVAWAREVVYRLSVERGIYSLGRAATGRRGVMVDDLPQDCRVITKLLRARSARDYKSSLDVTREDGQ